MAPHSDFEIYSQESHQPSHFNHQPRRQNNAVDLQGDHYLHQEAQYRTSNRNFQRGRSQGSYYHSPGKYRESSNFGQGNWVSAFQSPILTTSIGNHDLQGPVQRQPSYGLQQFSSVPQQRYGNYMRTPSMNGDIQGVPTGPRVDRRNNRFSFSDRSSQNSMDDARALTYWHSPVTRPATDASISPRIPHEPQDLIDLHHGPEIDSNQPHKTALDLLEEDPPEDAKSMPIIIAAVSQESRSMLDNSLYELMAPLAEGSPQDGDRPAMDTSCNGLPNGVGQTKEIGSPLKAKGAIESLSGASQNLKVVLSPAQNSDPAPHGNPHDPTIEILESRPSTSTPENLTSTATTKPSYLTISSDDEETINALRVWKAYKKISPHLKAKLEELGNSPNLSTNNLKPGNPLQPEPAKTVANNRHVEDHSVAQPGEAKSTVTVTGQATLNINSVENSTAVATTTVHPKQSETHSDSDDDSYPSSVFSSLPSSPRFTTLLPVSPVYHQTPLPFPVELSFEEFKKKNICVSNVSYDRLYAADSTFTGVGSWEAKPVSDSEKSPVKESQSSRAPSPKQPTPAVDDEFHGDSLLGPRPKPRWNQFSGNLRPPSPDTHLTSDEPQRITRQHIFDIAYCWNCWSLKHKAVNCPEPHRDLAEREQLRVQKRVVSKSWARELESMGRQPAIIPMPGVSDEEAFRLQVAVPLRNPRKKVPRNFSPAISVYEGDPGSPTDRPDWWNNTPPIPDISDAEVAEWAKMTDSSTARHEGTYFEHPWSDTSMESGAETTISSESTEAHMDGACYISLFNSRSTSESEDESTTSLSASSVKKLGEGDSFMAVDCESSGTDGNSNGVVDVGGNGEGGRDGKEEPSDEEPIMRIREPRPEELQEPQVIFVDSELFTPPRHRRRNTSSDKFEKALCAASLNRLSPRGRHKHPRKCTTRVDRISRLPTEILHEIVEYVGLQRLYDDPQNESTVYERSRAESVRALDLRPLRFVNRKFYLVVQTIIYTRINITAIPDFERLARQLHMRERLANMVLDVTVDIHQLRKSENWRDYGNPKAIAKSREGGQKMTLGTAHLIRDISSIFENCKFLSRFAFHCTGAAQAFCRLEGHYPSVRKVSVCDQLEIGKCGDMFWQSIQRFPNIEEVSLLRAEENRDLDFRPIQINPVGKAWAFNSFGNLQYLKFTNAAEISDKLLLYILPNLPKLSRIYLYECKLVTSSGLLKHLSYLYQCH